MKIISRLASLWRNVFHRDRVERDLDDEIHAVFRLLVDEKIRAGFSPGAAHRAAMLELGGLESVKEQARHIRAGAFVHQICRDLAFGTRLLRRKPGLAAISVLVVAAGVGTTTAIFSVVYGTFLKPLPYNEPERLVALWSRHPEQVERRGVNPADQREWRTGNTVFEDIALANAPQNFNLIGAGEPERLIAARLSSNLLAVLGVSPALGRSFTADDERLGRDRLVLLADDLWRRRFGADPAIVGRTINLSGDSYLVVGVMRPEFQFPQRQHQLWIPLTINPRLLARETSAYAHLAVARLRPGVSTDQAQREMNAIAARLELTYPATNRGIRIEVLPLREESVRAVRLALYVMFAAVSCLLVIASLNLAGLLAARAAGRAREFTVRRALGASRGRLMLQALAEVAPMLAIGGLGGIAIARIALAAFIPLAPAALPRVDSIAVNGAVLSFSLAVLLLTGVVAGLLPAMYAWRATTQVMTTGSRSATPARDHLKTRDALVVAQLALTLPLLVGATALVRTVAALMEVDPGFRAANVFTLHMAIPRTKYQSDEQIAAFYRRLVDQVSTIPGVLSAGMVNRLPMTGNDLVMSFEFEDHDGRPASLQSRSVTPGYFRSMNIPVRGGRVFTEEDRASAPLVGVIDERAAHSLWPGQSAVGKRYRVSLPGQQPAWGQIVGVVGTIRHGGLDRDSDRQMYFSYHQFTDGRIALVVRSQGDVRALGPAVTQAIHALDPEQPVYDVKPMTEVLTRSEAQRWLIMSILTVFAMSSLLLASAGTYGVMSHGVTERRREFGIRLALGAVPSEVSRLVLRRGSILASYGALLGLGGAIALALATEGMLYGVRALDPLGFATGAGALIAVALVASYVPARRAARTDPVHTLRAD